MIYIVAVQKFERNVLRIYSTICTWSENTIKLESTCYAIAPNRFILHIEPVNFACLLYTLGYTEYMQILCCCLLLVLKSERAFIV